MSFASWKDCVSYDGPLTGWSKVEKLTGCVKSHLKKRSIVSTLDQRQDYYRFIFRSLMTALSNTDDRSISSADSSIASQTKGFYLLDPSGGLGGT